MAGKSIIERVKNFLRRIFSIRNELPKALEKEFIHYKDVNSIDRIQTSAWLGFALTICMFGLDIYRVKTGAFYENEWYPRLFKFHLLGLLFLIPAIHTTLNKAWIVLSRLRRGIVIWGMVVLTIVFLLGQAVLTYLDRDSLVIFLGYIFVAGWMFAMSHRERIIFNLFSISIMAAVIFYIKKDINTDMKITNFLEIFFLSLVAFFFDAFDFNLKLTNFMSQREIEREQERIRKLEEFKSRFFTNLTHEFRTPLTTIIGMSNEIAEDPKRWSKEGTNMIRQNAGNLLNLINQILNISKIESGTLATHMIQGDIISFTGYVIDSLRGHALNKHIGLHFLCNEDQILMDYDPDKFTIILSNLISNAVKFSPVESNVYISLHRQKGDAFDYLEISVKDNGIGIPKDQIEHIFERFFQVDNAVSVSGIGTGVGLSLVKELVQLFAGDIQVISTNGKGTQFTVLLPIHNTSALDTRTYSMSNQTNATSLTQSISEDDKPDIPIEDQSGKPEILIIEDNSDVLKYLRICLGDLYNLSVCKDGEEGVIKAIHAVPNLILSDVMMPLKDGLTVCRELKHNPVTSHIPIILLSAKADAASRIAGLESGADVYMTKPFEKEELKAQIQNLLDRFKEYHLRYANPESIPVQVLHENLEVEDEFITRIRNLVHQHLDDNEFSVNDLERGVFLSRSQLHKKLKALTGLSAMQFVSRIRFSVAREKLKTESNTISDIAYQVGYSDPNYFSRAYSEEFGETPSETRNNFKNKLL